MSLVLYLEIQFSSKITIAFNKGIFGAGRDQKYKYIK